MKVLQIIDTAYRATIEEQDDTVVWITHAMAGAGGDFDVLLSGNAVNYSVKGQNAEGLSFGNWQQTQPPKLSRDIAGLMEKGIDVYLIAEDAEELGLRGSDQLHGVRTVSRAELPRLFENYERVWRW